MQSRHFVGESVGRWRRLYVHGCLYRAQPRGRLPVDAWAAKRRRAGMYPGSQGQKDGLDNPPRTLRDVGQSASDLLPDPDESRRRLRGQAGSSSVTVPELIEISDDSNSPPGVSGGYSDVTARSAPKPMVVDPVTEAYLSCPSSTVEWDIHEYPARPLYGLVQCD